MSIGKRQLLYQITGLTRWRWQFRPNGIYAFNYHRIGNSATTAFDPNVFSCDVETFRWQLDFLAKHFDLVSVEELSEIIASGQEINRRLGVITFDDGYLDNFEVAMPILKEKSIPAVFFVTSGFTQRTHFPWWDDMAWVLRNHAGQDWVDYEGQSSNIPSAPEQFDRYLEAILRQFKKRVDLSIEEKMDYLKSHFKDVPLPDHDQLLMNWDHLRSAQDMGFDVGAHTVSHVILSACTAQQQRDEIAGCKASIEAELKKPVRSFAYPVGMSGTFTRETEKIVEDVGYDLAFSLIPGTNPAPQSNRYAIRRFGLEADHSEAQMRYTLTLNREW